MEKKENSTKYIVKDSAAAPRSGYRRVAVLEVDADFEGEPTMISTHARGVRRVVKTWEDLHSGATDKCAFQRALKEARELAARLNARTL